MLSYILIFCLVPLTWANCPTDTMCEPAFNKCYKFVTDVNNFYNAEEKCMEFGGHLVSIQNSFENSIIGETAMSMFSGLSDYWIGANYMLNNKWSWTDGSGWSYTHWFPGEPSTNEAVAVLLNSNLWQSVSPTLDKPYVCQIPSNPPSESSTIDPKKTCPTAKPETCLPRCESGWTYNSANNFCYKSMVNQKFWDAERLCKEAGAHLASIHNEEENIFVGDLAASGFASQYPAVTTIGIYQSVGQWYWTDNTTVNYLNWGDPSKAAYFGVCTYVFADGYSSANGWYQKWQGNSCEKPTRNFICKMKAT